MDELWLLSFSLAFVISFISLVIGFLIGIVVHWLATREQRHILKRYREREQQRKRWNQPVE
ncbi:YhcB family protein [Reticulibacter mediterranei]|uniref:YhcB family protein n=1 Tax=Reticulibacter mediterranei TaxID=2778369 RepID=UPI001C689828|nr:YhcB family protein [Reticulibacter mediterranei]